MEGLAASMVSIPVVNLLIICGTLLTLVGLVAMFLKNMGVIQFGSFTVKKDQEGQSIMHSMNEENNDLDDLLKLKLRQMTNSLRNRITNMFSDFDSCEVVPGALAASLRYPLYESIGNNHYTKELMPTSFPGYRQRMLESLRDEYLHLRRLSGRTSCQINNLPEWDDAADRIEQFLDMWLRDLVNYVKDCSESKLLTYKKYLEYYDANKDAHRSRITKDCIEKNERYVRELDERSMQLSRDIRQREEKL